jgi:hypothetical protein
MLNLSSFDRYRTLENGPFIAVIGLGLHDRLEKLIDGTPTVVKLRTNEQQISVTKLAVDSSYFASTTATKYVHIKDLTKRSV